MIVIGESEFSEAREEEEEGEEGGR